MNNNRFFGNKCLLLAVILIAMFSMSGCRTRITNNSEVSNVYYDEDGFLTETYQMRRDELGLSTAERPILPNLGGSSENDRDDFDTSEDSTLNYQPEEDNYVEPPATNTTTNTTTNTNTTTTTNRSTTPTTTPTTPSRSSRSSTNSNNESISITFKPGKEGKITGLEKGKSLTKTVPKNSSIQVLASDDVDRSGYTLTGWKDSDGNEVKPGKSLKATKKTTYTAQWKKKETQERKTKPSTPTPTPDPTPPPTPDPTPTPTPTDTKAYGVNVTVNGGELMGEIKPSYKEGESFNLPNATKTGYKFKGWLVNGSKKGAGDQVKVSSELEIVAEWELDPVPYWKAKIEKIDNNEYSFTYFSDDNGTLMQDCNGVAGGTNPDFAIGFVDIGSSDEVVSAEADKLKGKGKKILVLAKPPKDAKEELVYKYYLFQELYGRNLGIEDIEKETQIKGKDIFKSFTISSSEGNEDSENSTGNGE